MNERIKELMDEAVKFRLDPDSNSYEAQVSPEDLELFAELIVRECIKAAVDPGDGLIKGDTWHDGVRASLWSIQQEFGLDRNFGIEP